MKLLTAIIQPHKLEETKNAFSKAGFGGMSVTNIQGFGKQKGLKETYRGSEFVADFLDKIKIEILLPAQEVERAVDLVISCTQTGAPGDGKIYVTSVDTVVRIRTKERDLDAI